MVLVWVGGLTYRVLSPREDAVNRDDEESSTSINAYSQSHRSGPIQPLEPPTGLDPAKVALGNRLFHEQGLSGDGSTSCASCHDLSTGGDDDSQYSIGIGGSPTPVNSPTVLNAALSFRQFWNGRAANLEEQIDGPITHPGEMGNDWASVVAWLKSQSGYRQSFDRIYDDGVSRENVRDAIATFERSLITVDSPFDLYLRKEAELEDAAIRGYEKFVSLGCIACHQGRAIGGNLFQKFGLFGNYFEDEGRPSEAYLGRFEWTGNEADRYVFKVPSLRNVAETGPYLHDGSIDSLDEVVRVMARYQLGIDLAEDDVLDVVAFLESLTGVVR